MFLSTRRLRHGQDSPYCGVRYAWCLHFRETWRRQYTHLLVFHHRVCPYIGLSLSTPSHQKAVTNTSGVVVHHPPSFRLFLKTCSLLAFSLFAAVCIRGRRSAALTLSVVSSSTCVFHPLGLIPGCIIPGTRYDAGVAKVSPSPLVSVLLPSHAPSWSNHTHGYVLCTRDLASNWDHYSRLYVDRCCSVSMMKSTRSGTKYLVF